MLRCYAQSPCLEMTLETAKREPVMRGVMRGEGEGEAMSSGARCQSKHLRADGGGECGKPAVWRYRALNLLPHLLCEECGQRLAAVPWMRKRLERLDAAMGKGHE